MKRYSIMQNQKKCLECGSETNIHIHEVFYGTSNRKKSIEDGCCVYLCGRHHNQSNDGIHFNKELNERVKKAMQIKWMETYKKSIEEFIKRYGRSYI